MSGSVGEQSGAVALKEVLHAEAPERAPTPFRALFAWGLLLFISVACIRVLHSAKVGTPDAPDETFSSARAMSHVRAVARQAHPLGTSAEADVRHYLLEQLQNLGISPVVQSGVGVQSDEQEITASLSQNVVGRLYGSNNSGAILLVAHYDSVDHSPGAADDGIGIATILETVRAIEAGPRLQNDVIVLFTDGEEIGLLGSELFTSSHPWANNIRVAFNFEARGDGGPALMFETSNDNHWLIQHFALVPRPFGTSLFYSLYKQLPNDTDFTVLKSRGIEGMNFAIGERFQTYHSTMDTFANLQQASLQQMGDTALSLTRQFGSSRFAVLKSGRGDDIFFDLLGLVLIRYPIGWALAFQIVFSLAVVFALILADRKGVLRIRSMLTALAAIVGCMVLIPAVLGGWWFLMRVARQGHLLPADAKPNVWLFLSVIILGVGLTAALLGTLRRKTGTTNLGAAGLLINTVIGLATAIVLPAGSYLLCWSLLIPFLLCACVGSYHNQNPKSRQTIILASAIPVLVLFCPLFFLLFIFLGLGPPVVVVLGVVLPLLGALLTPLLEELAPDPRGPKIVFVCGMVSALVLGTIGLWMSHFGPTYPRPDSLLYSLDGDHHKALWISLDRSTDKWTSQYLGSGSQFGKFPDYVTGLNNLNRQVVFGDAPAILLEPPSATVVTADTRDGLRTLQLRIHSARRANSITLAFTPESTLFTVDINGRSVKLSEPGKRTPYSEPHVTVYGVDDTDVSLGLTMRCGNPCRVTLLDRSFGLPVVSGYAAQPRPQDSRPTVFSDVSIVYRNYDL